MVQLNLTTLSPSLIARFWAKVHIPADPDSCWVWSGYCSRAGYGTLRDGSRTDKTRRLLKPHRVSWVLHNGPIPDGLLVCHHCDNPPCVNPQHLFLGTDKANIQDASRKGRLVGRISGEHNGRARLTARDIYAIRHSYKEGHISQGALGAIYGVSGAHIDRILHRQAWAHLADIEVVK